MTELSPLLQAQDALESRFCWFLGSLDSSRTVTLAQLLRAGDTAKLGATWIDLPLFAHRLESAARFVSSLLPHDRVPRWKGCPLAFFQSSPNEEDRAEHRRRIRMPHSLYKEQRRKLPPQIAYLHFETSWLPELRSTPRGRIVTPLTPYSNRGGGDLFPAGTPEAEARVRNGTVLGYRLPDFPALLGVSATVATDMLARIVIHDIGHGVLPPIGEPEELHNVVMLNAMGAERVWHEDPWEQLLHDECTDPLFFLRAQKATAVDGLPRHALHRRVLEHMRRIYVQDAAERRVRLWDIPADADPQTAETRVRRIVREMRLSGFSRYETRDIEHIRRAKRRE